MKKLAVLIFCFFSYSTVLSQGVEFRNITYEDALKAAAKENKMVFLHGYAEWCHYCHDMVEKIYPDSAVGKMYNENFINIKLDLEKEGAQLNKRLKSHTFPTLVFFDSSGTIMHRAAGRHMKPMIIELAKEAMSPVRRLHTWEQLYNKGMCSADTAYKYLRKMEATAVNYQPEALMYLSKLSDDAVKAPENWKIINDLYKDVESPFMTRLITMKKDLEQLYSKPAVDRKIFNMYKYEFGIRIRTLDSTGYFKLKNKLSSTSMDIAPMISSYAELMKAKMKSEYNNYFILGEKFIIDYASNDAVLMNEVAQVFYEKTKDPALLQKAEAWARESVKMNDTYTYNETLAGLLILQGKKEAARSVTEHAIDVGLKEKANVQKAKIFLTKIEEMQ